MVWRLLFYCLIVFAFSCFRSFELQVENQTFPGFCCFIVKAVDNKITGTFYCKDLWEIKCVSVVSSNSSVGMNSIYSCLTTIHDKQFINSRLCCRNNNPCCTGLTCWVKPSKAKLAHVWKSSIRLMTSYNTHQRIMSIGPKHLLTPTALTTDVVIRMMV